MKIQALGVYGGQLPGKHNTGMLLDGTTMIDAGTIGLTSDIETQRGIRRVLLSHAHMDHIEALPFFAVNIVSNKADTVEIAGSQYTLDAVKNHQMNGIIWPDFTKIKNFGGNPIYSYRAVEMNKWFEAGPYKVKAVPVTHTIPTNGFIIGRDDSYFMYTGDTKTTDLIWKEAAKLGKKLKAVIAELSFPNELASLADASAHYVPKTLEADLKKLGGIKPRVYCYHIKPEYNAKIRRELKGIKSFKIEAMEEKETYKV